MNAPFRLLIAAIFLAACGAPGDDEPAASGDLASAEAEVEATAPQEPLPQVVVFKTASCGCCNGWVEHLQEAGFEVEARDVRDLVSVKLDAGVPGGLSSCHTAIVDGYVVEGHVPADVVKRLLAERPELAGIAAPGMPVGSPGMEGPNAEPYLVQGFTAEGETSVYAEVDPR